MPMPDGVDVLAGSSSDSYIYLSV